MADHSLQHETLVVDAPRDFCVDVAKDIEQYPEWVPELKEVTVDERDAQGLPVVATFRVGAFGRSTTYSLRYDFAGLPDRISWVLETGELTTKLDGSYRFDPVEGEPGRTDVNYDLEVELVVPLPAIVKNRAEIRIIHTALRDLKARIETLYAAAQR